MRTPNEIGTDYFRKTMSEVQDFMHEKEIKPLTRRRCVNGHKPDDIDHLLEEWLIRREQIGNFTALRELEAEYPEYPELSERVMEFIDIEHIIDSTPDHEYTPEEEAEIEEMTRRSLEKCLAKIKAKEQNDMQTFTTISSCANCANVCDEHGKCSLCESVKVSTEKAKSFLQTANFEMPKAAIVGLIALIGLSVFLFSQCPNRSVQPANAQRARTK